jgi:drug/metabolite transporter (DMT)-like permease
MALLAFIPTLVGHTIVQRAARHLSPALVALVSPGETVGALAIGAVFLHAPPRGTELVGAALVLVGVFATVLAQRPSPPRGTSVPRDDQRDDRRDDLGPTPARDDEV